MKALTKRLVLMVAIGTASITTSAPTVADDWPLVAGDFWEVSGIHIKDGGGFAYATFLASEWRKNQEFAKSKGWIQN